jgi:hypothetical protein
MTTAKRYWVTALMAISIASGGWWIHSEIAEMHEHIWEVHDSVLRSERHGVVALRIQQDMESLDLSWEPLLTDYIGVTLELLEISQLRHKEHDVAKQQPEWRATFEKGMTDRKLIRDSIEEAIETCRKEDMAKQVGGEFSLQ